MFLLILRKCLLSIEQTEADNFLPQRTGTTIAAWKAAAKEHYSTAAPRKTPLVLSLSQSVIAQAPTRSNVGQIQLIEKTMRNLSATLLSLVGTITLSLLTACGGNLETSNPPSNVALASLSGSNSGSSGALGKTSGSTAVGITVVGGTAKATLNTSASTTSSANILGAPPSLAAQKNAARFLAQASFGPNMNDILQTAQSGNAAWMTSQFSKPQTLHRTYLDAQAAQLPAGSKLSQIDFFKSFWKQAVTGEDQLRQRTAFALSEIFVISFQNSNLPFFPRGVASYYDTLGQHAFGNYRDLLDAVARHPMMGMYLSSMGNRKENNERVPDENFAREILQLFSIGLYQLNPDGSLKLKNGLPIETYAHADVAGLSKALTGWSWAGPDQSEHRFKGQIADANRDWLPMQNYTAFHSTSEKRFLNATINGTTSGEADLKVAIEVIFNHPNVGPFIGKQLIQRLVTSNPSPAYVQRVANAFANNGQGVRGDMKAVLRAILLDVEAQNPNFNPANPNRKVREPIVRFANWMRAFNATSTSGKFLIGNLDDPMTALGQNPLRAPSVFNFQRPGYVPPNTAIANANLTAPEMQITNEISVAGYLNFMMDVIPSGVGIGGGIRDVQPNYNAELALVSTPSQLIDRIDLLLLNGTMSATLRNQILAAVNSVVIPVSTSSNAAQVALAKANRVHLSIFLAMASPEYLVQK